MVAISSLFSSWWGDAAPTKLHHLEDELLQDIFSRLPAKYVLRCRSVCRRWNALTSTQYFAQLHQKNCFNPTILLEKMVRFSRDSREIRIVKKKLYSFDGWEGGETHETLCEPLEPKFHEHRELVKYKSPKLYSREDTKYMRPQFEHRHVDADEEDDKSTLITAFSSCGWVIFHQQKVVDEPFPPYCIILNPITREKVTIRSINTVDCMTGIRGIRGLVYALFYHPVLMEFCIIWGQVTIVRAFPWRFLELKLLNLGPSKPCWRKFNVEQISCFKKHPPRFTLEKGVEAPVINLDDVVYWMVDVVDGRELDYDPNPDVWWPNCCQEAILAYNIKNEEISLLPHPGPMCESRDEAIKRHKFMVLIVQNQNRGGHLSLCQFSLQTWLISIWIFEEGLWVKHRMIEQKYCLSRAIRTRSPSEFGDFRPIMLIDKELLLVHWAGLDLILCNLKLGICKQYLESKKMYKDEPTQSMHAHTQKIDKDKTTLSMHAHTHSFVSIGRSKLEILMETNLPDDFD